MSSEEFALEARDVWKSYMDEEIAVPVLRGVSLAVARGETVAITGSSGAGKSTLLHCLGGLDGIERGTILVGGMNVNTLSERDKGVLRNRCLGFVYQFHHLLPEFTALENVAMPLLMRRMDEGEAKEAAAGVLSKVGLAERLGHLPSQLSGGERQRTAIARAMVTSPLCILADEPTGNLDRDAASSVWDTFLGLASERGTAIVIVTHDMELAGRCRRVLRISGGVLENA